jgi:outer membrane receptor protein involved in Fe transport
MKVRTLLVAAVMFVALSAAAFAQATFSVGSIPVTTVTASGNTEKSGDITFSVIQGSSPSVLGTITITYGVPITVDSSAIVITGFGGFAANAPTLIGPFTSGGHLDGAQGKLVLSVPANILFGTGASFTVSGARVQIAAARCRAWRPPFPRPEMRLSQDRRV